MYCWKCGASIRDDANFCPICGSSMKTPADAERNCRECGAQLQKSEDSCTQCVTAASEANDGPLLADGINQAAPADAVATDYKGVPCSFSTSKDKKETKKGVLSGFFSIDGKSLAYVVCIMPLKLLLYNIIILIVCVLLSDESGALYSPYFLAHEFIIWLFIATYGITYPCALKKALKKQEQEKYDTWESLARFAAIFCATVCAILIMPLIGASEIGWLYGTLYLAVAIAAVKSVPSIPNGKS